MKEKRRSILWGARGENGKGSGALEEKYGRREERINCDWAGENN